MGQDIIHIDPPPDPVALILGEGETEWYALRVRTQKEFVCALLLRRAGVHTFVPTEVRYRRRNRYAKGKDELAYPIIPGTVFAGFSGIPAWFNVLSNALVTGVIGHDGDPWRLDVGKLFAWRGKMLDGCLTIDGGMRLVEVQGKGPLRSSVERPHVISRRKREPAPVVEPTRNERLRIGGMVLPPQLVRAAA